jgi:putative membrane protein
MEHVLCGATYIKSLKILKIIFMKKSIPAFAILLSGSILFAACNGSNSNNTNTDSTTTSSTMTSDTNKMDHTMTSSSDTANNMTVAALDDASKKFIEDAGKGGMMEVDLGNMAINNASSQAVKDFGKMMVDDHTKLNNELKDVATKKNVSVPAAVGEDHKKDMDELSKKTGNDFDKAYVKMMVKDHKEDIDEFKKASQNLTDNDLKTLATNALPVLQKHLDAIQAIQKKM